jgi:RNA polymerase sigma-70 factor (ECF subfamily)
VSTPTSAELEPAITKLLEMGDFEEALAVFVKGYGPPLLGYLTTLLRDEAAAFDVFSECCERIWKGLPSFRRESSVKTWA